MKLVMWGLVLIIFAGFLIWFGNFSGIVGPMESGPFPYGEVWVKYVSPGLDVLLGWVIPIALFIGAICLFNEASSRRRAKYVVEQSSKREICQFTCPGCSLNMGIPRETINRIGVFVVNCRRCGAEIHFDGERIIKFTEPPHNNIV